MADPSDVLIVQNNLPAEAGAAGWDEEKIAALLDSGLSVLQTIREWWSYRASSTASFVSVSESGSSRSLSDIHKQALAMLQYWDKRIAEAEAAAEEEENAATLGHIRIHRAKRV